MTHTPDTPTVEEHLRWITAQVPLLPVSVLPLHVAHGKTLAEDVTAAHALPLWDNSAMDGYALRAADISAAREEQPVTLTIVGEVAAGSPDDPPLHPGEAVRIMTGAPTPTDADTVVPVELTGPTREPRVADRTATGTEHGTRRGSWAEHTVDVYAALAAGANIRRAGEDTPRGAPVARSGELLTSARRSALAAAGADRVTVRDVPRVAVVTTGSELQAPGAPLVRGQIPESNSLLIAGLLEELGIHPTVVTTSQDDPEALRARLAELAADVDVVVTTGGVGPGRHDIVRIALAAEPNVRAVRVRVKPGQPQCAGPLEAGPWIFALPGNPVSAAVSFELFVRPALLQMQGRGALQRLRLPAVAAVDWRGSTGRLQVLPVRLSRVRGELHARPAVNPHGVSHAVGGYATVDGYALVGADHGDVRAGDAIDVIMVTP